VADMTEDDVMLMTVSEGIAGGVRYGCTGRRSGR
ncbi:phage tail assembly protein T, partial [Escherichia coli]|nr:phage tail assembly protein T [Escherichia coli]